MKNKAKLLSIILTLALLICAFPVTATAAELTVVSNGIYTNGNPVIIAAGTSGTLIYYDADADGEIDESETPMEISGGPSGDSSSGYALGSYDIYGTAVNASVASSKITMLGGTVSYIFGSGPASGVNVTGNTDITFKGGTAAMLYGGGNYGSVGGNTNVTVTGGTVSSIVGGCGGGMVSGSANVTITGGTISGNVYGGGWGGSVSGAATVTVGVDAGISGTVTSACHAVGTVGAGSKVIYEVAFYDISGGSIYDSDSQYPPQWITSGSTAIKPTADPTQDGKAFSGWKKVGDGSAYDFTAAVSAAVKLYPGWLNSDAMLKASTTVKGETVTSLGTPSGTLGSETAGSVIITVAQAADTSNTGNFITLFDKNDTNADVKAVKYASGASTASFAGDTAYTNEALSNNDFFIVRVTAQDGTTINYYRINVTVTPNTTVPTATATGGKFILGASGSVDLFSSATAATNDDGQTFTGATLTAVYVSDTTEYLTVDGTDIPLIGGASGTFSAGSYRVTASGTMTSVVLSGMALDDAAMGVLIDGIAYKNSASPATAGNRVIRLDLVTDSGGSNYISAVLGIKSTVIVGNIASPVGETMDISACAGGDVILISAGRSVTLDGNSEALTNVRIYCEAGVTLTLNDVSITDTVIGYSPVTFTGENNTLIITGENSLSAGAGAPGVDVSGAALRIRGTGSLTARSAATTVGYGGAGIGTTDGATYDIDIEGGNITAIAGATNTRGAKIMSSPGISAADISITSGTVTATGYSGCAGIGSDGSADGSSITISGGVVTAKAEKFSVGIGCTTYAARSDDKITISGGHVIASCSPAIISSGASYAMGTGIGNSYRTYDGSGGTIELTGGEIFAGFALPSGCTAGGHDIGDANILQDNTNWTVSIGGSAKVFLFNNRISECTTSTHINKTYDAGTAEVYGVTIPEGWQSAGFGTYLRPCTLSYDVNGGSGTAPDSVTRLYDTTVTLSDGSGLSRANYHFDGWNTAADGSGASYAAGGTYSIRADTTLYATWVGNTYTVNYDANGGTVDPASQVKRYGSTYGKSSDGTADAAMPTPAWAGHSFTGWYTEDSGGTKVTDSDTVSITGDTTFYAQWTTNTCTVTFSTDGGSPVSSITQDYNSKIETSPTSSKTGYTFGGWYTEEALKNKVSFPCTITASATLYAKWTAEDSGGTDYTPEKTITVTESSNALFSDSKEEIKAEANMNNAFSSSVEVKVTDTDEKASGFGLDVGADVYPFDISLYIKGTNARTEPRDGYAVTISLPVPGKLLDVKEQLSIVHKSHDGSVTTLESQLQQINGVWYLVFEAMEFSPYALVVNKADTCNETTGLPYYVSSDGTEIFIGFAVNGKYIAPSGVTVLFRENIKSFKDTSSHWAKNYIDFVTERELFTGTGDNRFEPDTGMTRAMFATVMGRLYERSFGEIEALSAHTFTDCDYGDYYGKYVDWAAKEDIAGGYGNGKFGPDDQITREQMAAILYHFADFIGVLPSNMDTALNYPDANTISSWAGSAALYCQSTGVITGRDGGNFVPQGTATRAEVAVILEIFIKNTLDKSSP